MKPEINPLNYENKDYLKIIKRVEIYLDDVKKRMGIDFDIEETSLYGSIVSTEHKIETSYKDSNSEISDIDVYIQLSNIEITNSEVFQEYYGKNEDFDSMIDYIMENNIFMEFEDREELVEIELSKLIKIDAHEVNIRKVNKKELDLNISTSSFEEDFQNTKRIILNKNNKDFNIEEEKIDKTRFNQGECTQMAVALKEYFPKTEYAVIRSLVVADDADMSEPEDRYWYEACHIVLKTKNLNGKECYLDVDGFNEFNENNKNFYYNSEQEGNKSELTLIKNTEWFDGAKKGEKNEHGVISKDGNGGVERVFFGQDCKERPNELEDLEDAKLYLKQNPELINQIKLKMKELENKNELSK